MLPPHNQELVRKGVRMMLEGLGEDPDRDGLRDTPERIAKMYSEILDGKFVSFDKLKLTSFAEEYTEDTGVMVHHIPFYAFCEHHMALFQGHFGMAYVPNGKLLGLSKLVRIFRHGCKVVTVQERITTLAVDNLMKATGALGAIVYATAAHSCMCLRGVKSPGSMTTTIASRGVYAADGILQQIFIDEASR